MDTNDTRIQNLLFLLSAAPIGLGCVIVSDDGETDAATTGQNTSGATDQATDGETDQATSAATSQATSEGETDPTATEGNDTTAGNDTTEGGGEYSEICIAYGDKTTECTMSEEYGSEALSVCQYDLDYYYGLAGEPCATAFEDFIACLNALDCADFTSEDPFCVKEDAAIDVACGIE